MSRPRGKSGKIHPLSRNKRENKGKGEMARFEPSFSLERNSKHHYGALHYEKWKAFKKYVEDFGNLEEYPPTHVVLWELPRVRHVT